MIHRQRGYPSDPRDNVEDFLSRLSLNEAPADCVDCPDMPENNSPSNFGKIRRYAWCCDFSVFEQGESSITFGCRCPPHRTSTTPHGGGACTIARNELDQRWGANSVCCFVTSACTHSRLFCRTETDPEVEYCCNMLLLHHSGRCESAHCSVAHCADTKTLWDHISVCRNDHCGVPRCFSSRAMLSHYERCGSNTSCRSCRLLNGVLRRLDESGASV